MENIKIQVVRERWSDCPLYCVRLKFLKSCLIRISCTTAGRLHFMFFIEIPCFCMLVKKKKKKGS